MQIYFNIPLFVKIITLDVENIHINFPQSLNPQATWIYVTKFLIYIPYLWTVYFGEHDSNLHIACKNILMNNLQQTN